MSKAFTIIELLVVIAIIALLSGIILFSAKLYINKGKDSNIFGSLVTLIPAGEVFYNGNSNSYEGFCDQSINSVIKNIISQSPQNNTGNCASDTNLAGICCNVESVYFQAWAACAREFADNTKAFCVDSRGVKKEMDNSACTSGIDGITQCPD